MLETGWSQAAKHLDRSRSVIQIWWNRWQHDGNIDRRHTRTWSSPFDKYRDSDNHLRLQSPAYRFTCSFRTFHRTSLRMGIPISSSSCTVYHAFHWLINTDNEDYYGFKTVTNDPQKTGIRFFLMNQGSLCDATTAESKFIVFPQNASSRRVQAYASARQSGFREKFLFTENRTFFEWKEPLTQNVTKTLFLCRQWHHNIYTRYWALWLTFDNLNCCLNIYQVWFVLWCLNFMTLVICKPYGW